MCPTPQSWMLALNGNLLHAGSPVSNDKKYYLFIFGHFPFVRTEWPNHSCCIGNFTFNIQSDQSNPNSLYEGDVFQQKTFGKSLFLCQNDLSGHGPAGQF